MNTLKRNTMREIRKKYNVPAKQGAQVLHGHLCWREQCTILSADKEGWLWVRKNRSGERILIHPKRLTTYL